MRRTAIVIGPNFRIEQALIEELQEQDFHVNVFTNYEDFLFDGEFTENSVYFVYCIPGTLNGVDLIRIIRKKDKISLIHAIVTDDSKEALNQPLYAGADYCSMAPLCVQRALVQSRNHFNRIEHLESNHLIGSVQLIPEGNTVIRKGKALRLTDNEFKIFSLLCSDADRVYSREEIVEATLEKNTTLRTVDVHISSLRRKLEPINFLIETVRGRGYQLDINDP